MGWFYGFKLHLICNERGELLSLAFTKGNIDDRKPLEDKQFIKDIYGKLVGDGGYISKSLFRTLFVDGIHLLTRLKTNMKGSILSAGDSLLIRKRAIIESVNDELKNIAQVEHSRHRSLHNFLVNMMSAISAYCLFPKKPSIRLEPVSDTESCRQLCLFWIHRTHVDYETFETQRHARHHLPPVDLGVRPEQVEAVFASFGIASSIEALPVGL